jgi:hypothetical protein
VETPYGPLELEVWTEEGVDSRERGIEHQIPSVFGVLQSFLWNSISFLILFLVPSVYTF